MNFVCMVLTVKRLVVCIYVCLWYILVNVSIVNGKSNERMRKKCTINMFIADFKSRKRIIVLVLVSLPLCLKELLPPMVFFFDFLLLFRDDGAIVIRVESKSWFLLTQNFYGIFWTPCLPKNLFLNKNWWNARPRWICCACVVNNDKIETLHQGKICQLW